MSYEIRPYEDKDFDMLSSWWTTQGELAPDRGCTPLDTTFVVEKEGTPLLSMSLFLTNSRIAMLENLIGNPECKNAERKAATKILVDCMVAYAKQLGYDRLFCITNKDKLKTYYSGLGFSPSSEGHTFLLRRL